MHKNSLKDLMNGPIREKLKIIPNCVKWGGTFLSASVDLMSCIIAFYGIAGYKMILHCSKLSH